MRVHKCPAFFLSELTKMENLKKFLLKIETKRMRIALIIQRLLMGAKNGGVCLCRKSVCCPLLFQR